MVNLKGPAADFQSVSGSVDSSDVVYGDAGLRRWSMASFAVP